MFYLRFYFVPWIALFNWKYIECKSIGINVSAVIIYICSLPAAVIHA